MVERTAIQGLGQVQSKQASRQTQSTGYRTGVNKGTSFLNDLNEAAGGLMEAGANYLQGKVEEDRVVQTQKALLGLAPTEDATTGGKRVHMIVNAQNKVMENTKRLQFEAGRYDGDDEGWAKEVAASNTKLQEDIYEKYPELKGDKRSRTELTNMFLEQQPAIAGTRIEAKIQKEHESRVSDFTDRLILETQGLSGETLTQSLSGLKDAAALMQLTNAEYEAIVTNQAIQQSSTGNTDLIAATKGIKNEEGTSLYQRDGKLGKAAVQGRRTWAANNQEVISKMKGDLSSEFLEQGLSVEGLRSKAGLQNDETGETTWTAEQINALISKRASNASKVGKRSEIASTILNGDLPAIGDYSKKELEESSEAMLDSVDGSVDALVRAGIVSDEDRDTEIAKRKTELRTTLAKAGIVDKQLKNQIDNLGLITSDHLHGMTEMPEEVTNIVNTLMSMPEDMRNNVVPPKQAAFVNNIVKAQQMNMNPAQAMQYAQNIQNSTKSFSPTELKSMSESAASVASDIADGTWGIPWDNMSSSMQSRMQDEAQTLIRNMRMAGYSNDDAEKQAANYFSTNYSKVGDTVVKGNRNVLASRMQIAEPDLELQLQGYLAMNNQELKDAAGIDSSTDDMYFDIDVDRGIARVRYGSSGMLVSDPISLDELGEAKYPQYLDTLGNDERIAQANDLQRRMNETFTPQQKDFQYGTPPPKVLPNTTPSTPFGIEEEEEEEEVKKTPPILVPSEKSGEVRKWNQFNTQVQTSENPSKAGFDTKNGVWTPFDSDVGTDGVDTIGYGHLLTKDERENGFILIDGEPVPFDEGSSQMTDGYAQKLFKQDIDKAKKGIAPKVKEFDNLDGGIQRALIDTAYNAGEDFLSKAPRTKALFDKGDYTSGFINLLGYMNEGGKRSTGLLKRRIEASNMVEGSPVISKYTVSEDGEMKVYLGDSIEGLDASIKKDIKDGWYTVVSGKKGSLHSRSKAGSFTL